MVQDIVDENIQTVKNEIASIPKDGSDELVDIVRNIDDKLGVIMQNV